LIYTVLFDDIFHWDGNLVVQLNILEPVVRRPSGYSVKHCTKSLLKKDFIPFLSGYVHSSTVTCIFLMF
jgi:hypothetical protein